MYSHTDVDIYDTLQALEAPQAFSNLKSLYITMQASAAAMLLPLLRRLESTCDPCWRRTVECSCRPFTECDRRGRQVWRQHHPGDPFSCSIWDEGFLYLRTHTYHGRPNQDVWYRSRFQIDSKWRGWLYHEASYMCNDSLLKKEEYYRPLQELFGHVMEVAITHQREALNLLLGATWQIVTKLVCLRADRSLRRSTNQPKFPSIYWF